jgi:hypothetical protein
MSPQADIVSNGAGAKFSACRRWRYLLWRRWSEGATANFIMLNPSTADEVKLDPTCTRAQRYAERWGYGALIVTNVFGWRSTDPRKITEVDDPVGRGNDRAILQAAREASLVVCAWGNHAAHLERSAKVVALLRSAGIPMNFLRMNSNGEPAHPLYLPGALRPTEWKAGSPTPRG